MDEPREKLHELIRWFGELGEKRSGVTWLGTDLSKLKNDKLYGLKCFLLYANQRSGSPRGYAVAGIKAVSICERNKKALSELPSVFRSLYFGQTNEPAMPVFDERIVNLDVPKIVALVEKGELAAAYDALSLQGAGHKIRSFFLRDIAIATGAESKDWTLEHQYMFCQPIDVWVRMTMDCLAKLAPRRLPRLPKYRRLNPEDREKAALSILLSIEAGTSPLHANHGIWYLSRHALADGGRLTKLLMECDMVALKNELTLMGEFADLF